MSKPWPNEQWIPLEEGYTDQRSGFGEWPAKVWRYTPRARVPGLLRPLRTVPHGDRRFVILGTDFFVRQVSCPKTELAESLALIH